MHEAPHDAVSLHLAKLLNQHLFRHGRYRTPQLGGPPDPSAEQMEQNDELPTALEDSQSVLHAFGGGRHRVFLLPSPSTALWRKLSVSCGREFRRRSLRARRGHAPRPQRPRTRPSDRASPASGWRGPNRAANRACPRRDVTLACDAFDAPRPCAGRRAKAIESNRGSIASRWEGLSSRARVGRPDCAAGGVDSPLPRPRAYRHSPPPNRNDSLLTGLSISEQELHRQLTDARVTSCSDHHERRRVDVARRIQELRAIERVEQLRAELQ
jgi:hypothetical protein